MQFSAFKLSGVPPPLDKMEKDERLVVLHRFTKANMKLNIPLEPQQLISLLDNFIDSAMYQVSVTYKDWKSFYSLVEGFSYSDTKSINGSNGVNFDIQQYVEVKMGRQNLLNCFIFFLERKFMQQACVTIFQLIVERVIQAAKSSIKEQTITEGATKEERQKEMCVQQIQLISLFVLINEYSEHQFKKAVKQNDSLKISVGKLGWFKDIHFFSWFLLKKMQDKSLKTFKLVKIGRNVLTPVQVADKQAEVQMSGRPIDYLSLGQELEYTYQATLAPVMVCKGAEVVKESEEQQECEWMYDEHNLINVNEIL